MTKSKTETKTRQQRHKETNNLCQIWIKEEDKEIIREFRKKFNYTSDSQAINELFKALGTIMFNRK